MLNSLSVVVGVVVIGVDVPDDKLSMSMSSSVAFRLDGACRRLDSVLTLPPSRLLVELPFITLEALC